MSDFKPIGDFAPGLPVFSAGPIHGGIPQSVQPGRYVNGVQVQMSPWDVVFEFQHVIVIGQTEAGEPQVAVQSADRVIMSPHHAKAFLGALTETLKKWEGAFGELPDLRQQEGEAS